MEQSAIDDDRVEMNPIKRIFINDVRGAAEKLIKKALPAEVWSDKYLLATLIAAGIYVIISSIVWMIVEPWNFIESLYFTIITITSVGYGDYKPSSDLSRWMVIVFIISGNSSALFCVSRLALSC
jgi:hypothetical protein